MTDGNPLDDPRVGSAVFFPRPDARFVPPAEGARDHLFDAPGGARLRLRIHPGPTDAPTVLFFHGNGETGTDYDPIAHAFTGLPSTFVVAEYRGYGPCSGRPSLSTFLGDARASLDETLRILAAEGRSRCVVAMGRSLGSAPAIDLAAARSGDVSGLVVESGFARVVPLLELIGVPAGRLGVTEAHGPGSLEKMRSISEPVLIIHAEDDRIIPIEDAEMLLEASADPGKRLVRVPGAGHNDIQMAAGRSYFEAIGALVDRACAGGAPR